MLASIKINTSILICFTFVFRLLFVNAGIVSSHHAQGNFSNKSNSATTAMKRNMHSASYNSAKSEECPLLEICEDDSNDNDKFKSKITFITRAFYLLVTNKTIDVVQKTIPTDKLLSNTLFNRYIAFQVFRI
jgi:tyrosine-protein phosphatase YwqE